MASSEIYKSYLVGYILSTNTKLNTSDIREASEGQLFGTALGSCSGRKPLSKHEVLKEAVEALSDAS